MRGLLYRRADRLDEAGEGLLGFVIVRAVLLAFTWLGLQRNEGSQCLLTRG